MIDLNISLYIVVAFLLLTLLVGVYFSRQKTSFREYAVGNKQFATATLVATVLATTYGGGGLMRNVESVYALGLFWIVLGFLNCFGSYIISRLALRMGPFMEHLSMAETIGSIYGTYARVITAFVGICGSIIAITAQIIVMSQAINICLGSIDPYVITVLSTLLLIFYSIFGGVRAVTYTDVLQFITFSIVIPLLCWFIFIKIGKPFSTTVATLQSETKFQFGNLFCFNKQLVNLVLLFLSFLVPYMGPGLMQRVYMSSSPMQAQKVFAYATFFKFIITFFILLIGVLVFASAPHLQKADIWGYIITCMPPIFKGFVAVALFAMAMSTADSSLNACSVMMSHDILQSLEKGKEMADARQLTIARRTTLVVGLLAMLLKFRCPDLLKLFYWSLNCDAPIIAAPFTLAIFGFRGTARTVLVGMVVGVLSILAWNQWVQPATGMNGSLVAMVANGLAMMATHYLLKQPKSAGWVEPDNAFKQIQQERARRQAERREIIRNAWANKKESLSKLVPAHTTIVRVGIYLAITSLLTYFIAPIAGHGFWLTLQLFLAACFVGYPSTSGLSKKIKLTPTWFIGLCWLMGLVLYLPLNLLGHWWHLVDPIFATSLSLTHFAVILSVLPLYLGIVVIAITLLLAIYPIFIGLSYPVLSSLCPLLMVSLFLFAIIICLKVQQGAYIRQVLYLKDQEKIRSSQQLKSSLYDAALVASSRAPAFKGHGFILKQVVRKVEESISFLDNNTPLFKEDFQSIINKLYDWVAYFNRREKAKDHAMLQPTKITLDKLMRKLEVALSQQIADPPRLLVEKISMPSGALCSDMVCDINQVVYLLAKAVLRVGRLQEGNNRPIVRIQLHPTALQFKQADPIDNSCPAFIDFQAIALVVSQASTPAACLPKVKERYYEIDAMDPQRQKDAPPSIDLEQDTISSMVRAHYGRWTFSMDEEEPTILFVFPSDVSDIRDKMTVKLPIDCLTSEASVTPKEQADSMIALMKFHDHICKSLCEEDPIDIKTVSGLILLLREHFRFKRHASGQLFYARAVGISEIVVDWVFHSPKVVYASLLYELVRHTCLPLSYVKEHYNLGVYAFVSNVVKIDKRQDLDHPSLLYVQNRLEKAIKENHLQLSVLFIKLAERLYDLRHAAGYIHPTEVHHMAQETLTIDIQIANQYLGPEIGKLLEKAAKEALKLSKHTGKEKTTG